MTTLKLIGFWWKEFRYKGKDFNNTNKTDTWHYWYYFVGPLLLLLLFNLPSIAQVSKQNPYDLPLVSDTAIYYRQIRTDSTYRLVNIGSFIPDVRQDIRYATKNNFTGEIIYPAAQTWVRLGVANALRSVVSELKQKGFGLIIYDAYRPYSATLKFWEVIHDTLFVAAPWKGSRHNRGCAVDVSLFDLATGKELQMPTEYDNFTPAAAADYKDLPPETIRNRSLLIRIMEQHGFTVMPSEWWHFDYTGWEKYPLMDIGFEELK